MGLMLRMRKNVIHAQSFAYADSPTPLARTNCSHKNTFGFALMHDTMPMALYVAPGQAQLAALLLEYALESRAAENR